VFFVLLAWRFEPTTAAQLQAAVAAVTFATLLPIASLFVLVRAGRLSDVEMRVRSERDVVYAVCLASYALGTVVLLRLGTTWPVWGFMALHLPNTVVLGLLNRRWKVSIHTTVIAGLCAAGLVFLGAAALPMLVLLPLAAWARAATGAHSWQELLAGVVLGGIAVPAGIACLRLLVGG
jgi:hypothetical protein